MTLTTSTIIRSTPLNFPFSIFKYNKKGLRKKANSPSTCSTMVLLLGIDPLLDNIFHIWGNITGSTILRKKVWQHVFFSAALDDRFW